MQALTNIKAETATMIKDNHIAPNMRPFLILETLSEIGKPMTASEIHRALALPKQTIHRLCNAMEAQGLLAREPGTRRLRPGRRARNMATGVLSTAATPIARHQILADLAASTGETVNLVTAREGGMSYIDRVETNWPIRVQLPIGTNVPFHCTASGKSYLASLPRSQRRSVVGALSLNKLTDRTITNASDLVAELDSIADNGHAIDDQEFVTDMTAIAVPVRDNAGRFFAAVAIHGPSKRFPRDQALANLDALSRTASRIEQLMF